MTFTHARTGIQYVGELVPDPDDYGRPVLVLSPKEGGEKLRVRRDKVPTDLFLSEATLNEVSLLDRGGFLIPRQGSGRGARS